MATHTRKKIMIVEDHAAFREGLKQVIRGMKELEFAGEAENGQAFLALLKKTVPDIVLMDIVMPVMDGLEAVDQALECFPGLKIIIISGHGEEEYLNTMIQKGIAGFVLKSARLTEIENAIRLVCDGKQYYSPELISLMTKKIRQPGTASGPRLTPREIQVLRLLCKGMPTSTIAGELRLSTRTVEGYRAKLLQKTGQASTIHLIFYALKNKLVYQEDLDSAIKKNQEG